MRCCWVVVAAMLLTTACTADADDPAPAENGQRAAAPEDEATEAPPAETGEPPTPEPEPCRHDLLEDDRIVTLTDRSSSELALALSTRTHRCAQAVVLAPADDAWLAAIAAGAAINLDAPLLLVEPGASERIDERLRELEAVEVLSIGLATDRLPGGLTADITSLGTEDGDHVALARRVADHLALPTLLAVPEDDARARTAALARLDGDMGLLPLPVDGTPMSTVANGLAPTVRLRVVASREGEAAQLVDRMLAVGLDAVVATSPLFRNGTSTTWVVDPAEESTPAVVASAARGRGDALLPVDSTDLRRGRDDTTRLHRTNPDQVVLSGEAATAHADWQLEVVLNGAELPGGGFLLFEDRRMVALYGSPEAPALGAMGEQPLDETIPRLREVAEPYGVDGTEVLPALEMIVTIASAAAEETGDYSRRTPIDVLRPWVDRAAEEEVYVVLDLQPGRTDFLTQAKEYEELLREPHVGLAIDPEWRLAPDQVHLQQIGSVEAEEVQQVVDWLAELTREHRLPQKLLILHQFRFSMLPDREEIDAPPELAVVVHMDGQGSQGAKDETYQAITAGVEDHWLWGWKNFYDEDEPVADPERVLDLDPLPVFVSYQ